ncbi:hypothetical protein CRG95_18505 [Escherichia sp. E4208]|uniref:StfH/YfcO family fimbrial adhesin n=1 Tax=unclassified Escherichia TaxID=2608889 RepID=UPI001029AB25|nr:MULTISPECIES: StfH/YfcO family fimbrial adhesin [unclassified Escherichia]RZM95046.1 DUF2544 domain-containing protein [Escherichia sp. E14V5]RZN02477.1 DUF2544 domain-containing protein [Escherichia sp. E14V7]RZN29283.1 DUF2544 domain-containing protein [Escherichia sp. E14V10]TGB59429.1 hypothetical protein CRT22_04790 [Escherichia sp. E5028]TGB82325.1 hypothetical protein CRG95_18505 [Escherichia sp. E4208]
MKKLRYFFCLLVLMLPTAMASITFRDMHTDMGYAGNFNTSTWYELNVQTSSGVYQGEYHRDGYILLVGDIPNISWNGPGPAPKINVKSGESIDPSNCPGLPASGEFTCNKVIMDIIVEGDPGGCPWIVTSNIKSQSRRSGVVYMGPSTFNSTCPPIPLDPYDVSWSPNSVVRSKLLSLKSTGGVIENTLPTFLMKDGKLCDGSQFDDRGAYCRFVSQMITFTSYGCTDNKVTTIPNRHAITDKQLHDIVVRVDTTTPQPIDSTCRFQYVLNML